MGPRQAPAPGPLAIELILESDTWKTVVRSLTLSRREVEIIERILRLDDDERSVATHLNMSSHTVHTHLERLYRKLRVSSRSQLVTRIFVTYVAMSLAPAFRTEDSGQRVLEKRSDLVSRTINR